ncbi:glutamic acid-rich protein-like [Helianthus annuus]|uniref:glutamic acid-rich protein-like n=1 Tax=Helianthus annuus TaxID=4232 RepID=UPI000B8FD48D|nr:glutamic acid-rich protein-like [Helianthus annuus]
MEKEKRDAEEAAEALKDKRKDLVIDKEEILVNTNDVEMKDTEVEVEADIEVNLAIIPVGEVKDVIHSEEASLRRIEVERRCLKEKLNKYKVDDDDEELKEMFGDEDEDDDAKDDKDDKYDKDDNEITEHSCHNDDDQDGASGLLITKPSGPTTIKDFLNDELNEQREEDQHHGESSSGTKHADIHEVFLNLPKLIYLNHTEEDGELVENWTRSPC